MNITVLKLSQMTEPDLNDFRLFVHVVNAGGFSAAARELGLPVVMIDRPALPPRHVVATVAEVMDWLHGTERGV